MSIAAALLPEFDEEFATTRKFLALVPDDKLAWKPHKKSMALGRLAWHLADFPEWCTTTIAKDALDGGDAGAWASWEGKQRADMVARFDRDLPAARATLANAPDAEFARHWIMAWGGQTIIDAPKLEVYRKWVVNHMVHHRAQLGVYLRQLDIAIPGAYGPSADEMGG